MKRKLSPSNSRQQWPWTRPPARRMIICEMTRLLALQLQCFSQRIGCLRVMMLSSAMKGKLMATCLVQQEQFLFRLQVHNLNLKVNNPFGLFRGFGLRPRCCFLLRFGSIDILGLQGEYIHNSLRSKVLSSPVKESLMSAVVGCRQEQKSLSPSWRHFKNRKNDFLPQEM